MGLLFFLNLQMFPGLVFKASMGVASVGVVSMGGVYMGVASMGGVYVGVVFFLLEYCLFFL